VTVNVVPRRPPGSDRVFIGVGLALDAEHPVVAQTINTEGLAKLQIPSGATIKTVNGTAVSSFYDVIKIIRQHAGKRVTIDYLKGEKAGSVTINADKENITIKSTFAEVIPFKHLERTYKASNPINAIEMGSRRTIMFITQAYVTLSRLIGGVVSPKNLMGPVGIMTLSYRVVAEQPLINYAYFLGLISAVIAVFNLLPLPPLDGGLVLLLLIERFKGTSLSERTQGIIAYAGWILIGTLLLYVTFNDIVRSFFS
jgi:regulator of sigma E protease